MSIVSWSKTSCGPVIGLTRDTIDLQMNPCSYLVNGPYKNQLSVLPVSLGLAQQKERLVDLLVGAAVSVGARHCLQLQLELGQHGVGGDRLHGEHVQASWGGGNRCVGH